MSIPVFIPTLSSLIFAPLDNGYSVGTLLRAIWNSETFAVDLLLQEKGVSFSQLSLRSLVSDLQKLSVGNSDFTAHSPIRFSWNPRIPSAEG
jgi:hypothetical protein